MVFTDVVGSTQLKQELGDTAAMNLLLQHHQEVHNLLKKFPDARVIDTAGDSFFLTFNTPSDAVQFALRLHARLRRHSQSARYSLQDRIGIHVGEVYERIEADSDRLAELNGIQVDTCARVMSLAGPGHTLLTHFAFENAQQMLKGARIEGVGFVQWATHGLYELKGLKDPIAIYEVAETGATPIEEPTESEKVHRVKDGIEGMALSAELNGTTLFRRVATASKTERRQAYIGAACATLIGGWLFCSSWLDSLSFDLSHVVRRHAPPTPYTREAAFVTIDKDSVEHLGQKSLQDWDRRLHARLLQKLKDAHAKAVVFDIVFVKSRPVEDPAFLAAIRSFGQVGVAVAQTKEFVNGLLVTKATPPFDELITNAWCGLTESVKTTDLTIRRPHFGTPGAFAVTPWNSLAEELALRLDARSQRPRAGAWLNYYCPPSYVPTYPYYQVLSNSVPATLFSNKVVFVGSKIESRNPDEPGSDFFRTPYSLWGYPQALGVVVNATGYLNLKRGDWLGRLPTGIELMMVLAVGLVGGSLLTFLAPLKAFIWGSVVSLGLAVVAIASMWASRIWFPWLVPCLVQIPCAVAWSSLANTRRMAAEKRKLQAALVLRRDKLAIAAATAPAGKGPAGTARLVGPRGGFEVPDHELLRLIGQGGYGQVWLARDIIGTFHAVKILQRSAFSEEQPFEREFHGLQRFTPISRQHPGLVQILHVGRNNPGGFIYYIMEAGDDETAGQKIDPEHYVPRNLSRDLARRGPLSAKETVDLAISLAEALEFLHGQNLIHRDIKPANIIFVNGRPKLADIGLVTDMAVRPDEVTFVGTAGYAAPEGPGTAAADIFSLGRLMYVACSGCAAQEFPELPSRLGDRPDAEHLLELNNLILKACEPVVSKRYPNAQPLLEDLRRLRSQFG